MNGLHTALPTVAKKYAWNLKYGLLGYPHFAAPEDIVRYLSASLPELSSVLDLGCGRGSLQRALRERGWTDDYCGVDISKPGIVDARNTRIIAVRGWSPTSNCFVLPSTGI